MAALLCAGAGAALLLLWGPGWVTWTALAPAGAAVTLGLRTLNRSGPRGAAMAGMAVGSAVVLLLALIAGRMAWLTVTWP